MARSASLALILSAILGIANAQVTVLDGGNFDATVVNGGKNAIVKFYAPWYDRSRADLVFRSSNSGTNVTRPPESVAASSHDDDRVTRR